jgi:pimeloyl-ACP methyl ester carboxylesterase
MSFTNLQPIILFTSCLIATSAIATKDSTNQPTPHTPISKSAQDHYIDGLLHKYHLAPQKKPFSYRYKNEIYSPLLGVAQQLPPEIEQMAIQQNHYLQNTTYFRDTALLKQGEKVRAYQLMKAKDQKESGSLVSAVTQDGVVIHGTLLNRNSSTLIVVGAGFTNYRELMAPMGDLFNSVDVLFFDYRGHGYKKSNLLQPKTWKNFFEHTIGIDPKQVRLGLSEELDVAAIVNHVCKHKKYNSVVGLGVCYSGLIFIKTAALYPNLFTKLILDGCWFSLADAVEILVKDPGMIPRPQYHSKWQNNWLIQQRWFQKTMIWMGQKLFNVEFNTVSVLDYAPLLSETMPILFIHGKNDLLIPREQFEILFHATNCRQKTAFITSNEHVRNHLKQKELYKDIVETFIDLSYEQFNHLIVTPEAMLDYKMARLQQAAQKRK